jgi:ferritin
MPEAVAAKEAPKTETKPVESSINNKLDQLVTIAKGIASLVGLTQKIVDKPTIEFEEADL